MQLARTYRVATGGRYQAIPSLPLSTPRASRAFSWFPPDAVLHTPHCASPLRRVPVVTPRGLEDSEVTLPQWENVPAVLFVVALVNVGPMRTGKEAGPVCENTYRGQRRL